MFLFQDFVGIDRKIIIHEKYGRMLWEIDLDKEKLKFLCVPENKLQFTNNYGQCVRYKQKIFFIPMRANHILVYDFVEGTHEIIEVFHKGDNNQEKFFPYIVKDNMLYIFPWRYPAIIVVDMDTYKVKTVTNWEALYKKYQTNPEWVFFRKDVLQEDDSVFLVTYNAPVIFQFNLSTFEYTFKEINECEVGFSTICKGSNSVVLTDRNGNLYKTDLTFDDIQRIDYEDFKEKYIYSESFYFDHKFWLIGSIEKVIVSIDENDFAVKYIEIGDVNTKSRIVCSKPAGKNEILVHTEDKEIFLCNICEHSIRKFLIAEVEGISKYYKNRNNKEKTLSENGLIGMKTYLEMVKNGIYELDEKGVDQTIGKKIINYVKEEKE